MTAEVFAAPTGTLPRPPESASRRLPLIAATALLAASAPAAAVWDVGLTGQAGQMTTYNRTANASRLGFPLAGGDVNGDGLDDLILTPMNADSGPQRQRTSAGEVVILLSNGVIAGERDLAALNPAALPADVTLIYGADAHDNLGTEVAAADLDGDGYAEAMIGAQYGDGVNNQRANCGEVVIVWGSAAPGGRVIDLANPPPGAVTLVVGAGAGDRLGVWVSAGDFDGDGTADALLGADQGSGPPGQLRVHAGETYVLYGAAALRTRTSIDLAAPATPLTVIYGIDREDHSGATVRGADVDRDGVDDVLIGAGLNRLSAQSDPTGGLTAHGSGGGDGRNNACAPSTLNCEIGEAYIVFGTAGVRPAAIDLAAPPASTAFIYGVDRFDAWGEELLAGDVNGDGRSDVAIGALTADGPLNARSAAGELALIPGDASGWRGAVIDLAAPPGNVTFIQGARAGAIGGDTAVLLDLDGDGKDDLAVASPGDRPQGRVNAGTVFVLFGSDAPLPATIDLAAVPATLPNLFIHGASGGDQLAYSMSLGDVNGDGLRDLILNAMGASGRDDLLQTAGDSYVLEAAAVSRAAAREVVPSLSGRIRYYSADRPVAGVRIAARGPAPHSPLSDAGGAFSLFKLEEATWTFEPSKTGGRGAGVSPLDASRVLQHIAQLRSLDSLQQLACDVTGDGTISTLDAVRILQLVAGLRTRLPVAETCNSDWGFTPMPAALPNQTLIPPLVTTGSCQPGAIRFTPLADPATEQDFLAFVFGDCTGNWTP